MTLTDRLGKDIAGYLQEEESPAMGSKEYNSQQQEGFFGNFFNLSPRSQQRVAANNDISAEEFHRRNQEFLQSSEQERHRMQKAMLIRDHSPRRQYVVVLVTTYIVILVLTVYAHCLLTIIQTNASIAKITSPWSHVD